MKILRTPSNPRSLIVAQAVNAFTDHAAKIAGSALVAATFSENQAAVWVGIVSAMYALPFVLCSTFAGWVADHFSKSAVIKFCYAAQSFGLGVLVAGAHFQLFPLMIAGLGLIAVQSSFLAPTRNAALRELAGDRLATVMGWLEGATVAALLAGVYAGGRLFDTLWSGYGDPWAAFLGVASAAWVLSLVAFLLVCRLKINTKTASEKSIGWGQVAREFWSSSVLRRSSLGLAWFYATGSMLVVIVLQQGRWDHGQAVGAASQGSLMAAMLGAGVAVGSILVSVISRKRIEVGLAFVGAIGVMLALGFAALLWSSPLAAIVCLFFAGLFGGLFSATINALLVYSADDASKGRVVAISNAVVNLMTVGFIGIQTLLSAQLGWSPQAQIALLAGVTLFVVGSMSYLVPESLVRLITLAIVKAFYPMKVAGALPEEGGVLLTCNHVTYADAAILYAASNRPVRFIGASFMQKYPGMRWVYKRFNVIPVDPDSAKDAIKKASEALKRGELVCIFPEGALTRTGAMMPFRKGVELIARLGKAPVVPAYLDGMWGSFFSYARKPFSFSRGMQYRRRVQVRFGESIPCDQVKAEGLRQAIMDLGECAYRERPSLKGSIGFEVLKTLKRRPFASAIIDRSAKEKHVRGVELLAASITVNAYLDTLSGQASRVGVLLPSSSAGAIANLGISLGGRSAVNLNPTVSADGFRSAIEDSGIEFLLSAKPVLARFRNLPLDGVKVIHLEDVLGAVGKLRLLRTAIACAALPSRVLAARYGLVRDGGDRELAVIFSSGSSAKPKGIVLSHRNVLGNCEQFSECYLMRNDDRLLANLPLFHSFGYTAGMWFPLVRGMEYVTVPSPLDIKGNIAASRKCEVSVLLGTPTFLKGYLKKATVEDFRSLRLSIAGAEKLSEGLARSWSDKFGTPVLEGYGLTECAPVVAANTLANPYYVEKKVNNTRGSCAGSAGRFLPGMNYRIVKPDDLTESVDAGESGLLLLRGVNVFPGYLDSTQDTERFTSDGWMNTGDIARVDEDGFLHIVGRLSRFSKIGGEMVPHQGVEEAIGKAFPNWECCDAPSFAIGSHACSKKGEVLVLLTRFEVELSELKANLKQAGIPNLWMPGEVKLVERLPVLGTGKLDLKRCAELCVAA